MKIITRYYQPPIPLRQFDWVAYEEGQEERGIFGWGRTESEAIRDFKSLVEDRITFIGADRIEDERYDALDMAAEMRSERDGE